MFFRQRSNLASLRKGIWRDRHVPEACETVQTMLMPDELRVLDFLTESYYRKKGAIVDAGCFLGGSTLALANGLRKSLARRRMPESKLIHSYDLFQIEDWTRGVYFPSSAQAGDSTRAIFERNIAAFSSLIAVHSGDIRASRWIEAPIEILFIDVAKHWTVCDWITENLFPYLIPGKSIVVQQDYLYHHWNAWLHVTMEHYQDHFEMLCDTTYNSVVFLFKKKFARGMIQPRTVESMSLSTKIELMDRAAARFSGEQKAWLLSAKEHFLRMLNNDR
jgi:hypothetical protein